MISGLVRMWLHDLLTQVPTGYNDRWASENVKVRNSEFPPWNFLWWWKLWYDGRRVNWSFTCTCIVKLLSRLFSSGCFRSQVLHSCRSLNQIVEARLEYSDCAFELLVFGFLSNLPSAPWMEQIRTSAVVTRNGWGQNILLNVQVCACDLALNMPNEQEAPQGFEYGCIEFGVTGPPAVALV